MDPQNTKSKFVLVVEDDQNICEILKDILMDEGYRVATAFNGQEALSYLKNNETPDLILLDVMMPVMDGISFRKTQNSNPAYAQIPTLVMSADVNIVSKLYQLQISKFIKKPIDMDDLLKHVCEMVNF